MTRRSRIYRLLLASTLGVTFAVGVGSLTSWMPTMLESLLRGAVDGVVGGGDFEMFWTAAGLAADGRWDVAYDLEGLAAVMGAPVESVSFAYPPPFALALQPLSYLEYDVALAIWLSAGVLAALLVLVTGGRPAAVGVVAMLFSLYVGLRFGQLAPLAMFWAYLGGRAIRVDRELLGGALLGLLVLKPQLLLGPLIVILATPRLRSRVLAGVIASAGSIVGLSLALAPEGWRAYASGLMEVTRPGVSTRWDFSIRATSDWIPAWGSVVIPILLGVAISWLAIKSASRTDDLTVKLAIGLGLSLLLSPRVVNYDWAILIPAIAWVAPHVKLDSPLVPLGAAVSLVSLSGFVNVSWIAWTVLAAFVAASAFVDNSWTTVVQKPG